MHRTALRGLYGSSNYQTKSPAVVSPVVDDMDVYQDGDLSTGEEGNGFGPHAHSLRRSSNNNNDPATNTPGAAVALKIHEVPEDAEYQLQRKSAASPSKMLGRLGVGQFFGGDKGSNQDQDTFGDAQSGQKYTVLGQKHQWRKTRNGRSRHLQTISHVEDDGRTVQDDRDAYSSGRGSAISRPSSYESGSSYREGTSSMDSSASDFSQGHSSGRSESVSEGERFIVTRQKKSKYSAKLQLTGQKPLYLGRYKNEAAALAACESAYSVVSTPRK